MGMKMNRVRCNGHELKIDEYDSDKAYSELKCYYCNTNISFVNSYERELGERIIIVQRYFRLKKGQEHESRCKYTVEGAVQDIYAACADDEMITKQDNKYVVRLMLASEDTTIKEKSSFSDKSGQGKRLHNYIPSGKKKAYLSTMNQIMKLRLMVESNSDLESKINLQHHDWNNIPYFVPWKNFYFDAEHENDYSRLLKYLRNSKVYHPVCIVGFIKSVDKYQEEKYCLKLEAVSEEKNQRIAVAMYFESKEIYNVLIGWEKCKIVVYAKFKFYRKGEWTAPDGREFIYQNITGNIYDKRQMLILNEEDRQG